MNFKNQIRAYALENALAYEKARVSSVMSKLFLHGLKKENIKEIIPQITKIIQEINNLKKSELEKQFKKYSKFLKKREHKKSDNLRELPNISKNMVFRIAPFPSGALHLGNARTFLLNSLYAEKYNGKTLLVIDDTIGSREKQIIPESYKLIKDSIEWLGIKYQKPIIYKSNRLKIYYKYAEKLIKLDKAYVCNCSAEKLRENRKNKRECNCRNNTPEKNLELWKKMFNTKTKPGSFSLRIKTDMKHPNPAFRDRVLFKISDRTHPRTGKKYRVWPLLDFSWAIDDRLLGVTHIIRGKDLMIETDMQKYIFDIFKWPYPEFIHMGLMKIQGIEGAKISKSKAQQEVASGKFIGWDDPRTLSIQSMKRRGILAESIRQFSKEIGLNQVDITIPIESLYAINRKALDKQANRYFFVEKPIKIKIKNMPNIKQIKIKIHPQKKQTRIIKIGKNIQISKQDLKKFKNKEIRLMHLFNIKLSKNPVLTSKENKDIQKLQWVSNDTIKTKILMPNGKWVTGLAEENIKNLKQGEIIQFERFGFCRLDKKNKDNCEFWFAHK